MGFKVYIVDAVDLWRVHHFTQSKITLPISIYIEISDKHQNVKPHFCAHCGEYQFLYDTRIMKIYYHWLMIRVKLVTVIEHEIEVGFSGHFHGSIRSQKGEVKWSSENVTKMAWLGRRSKLTGTSSTTRGSRHCKYLRVAPSVLKHF